MGKFHINGKGKVEACKATKKPCPLAGNSLHVEANSLEEAQQKVFVEMAKTNSILAGVEKPSAKNNHSFIDKNGTEYNKIEENLKKIISDFKGSPVDEDLSEHLSEMGQNEDFNTWNKHQIENNQPLGWEKQARALELEVQELRENQRNLEQMIYAIQSELNFRTDEQPIQQYCENAIENTRKIGNSLKNRIKETKDNIVNGCKTAWANLKSDVKLGTMKTGRNFEKYFGIDKFEDSRFLYNEKRLNARNKMIARFEAFNKRYREGSLAIKNGLRHITGKEQESEVKNMGILSRAFIAPMKKARDISQKSYNYWDSEIKSRIKRDEEIERRTEEQRQRRSQNQNNDSYDWEAEFA